MHAKKATLLWNNGYVEWGIHFVIVASQYTIGNKHRIRSSKQKNVSELNLMQGRTCIYKKKPGIKWGRHSIFMTSQASTQYTKSMFTKSISLMRTTSSRSTVHKFNSACDQLSCDQLNHMRANFMRTQVWVQFALQYEIWVQAVMKMVKLAKRTILYPVLNPKTWMQNGYPKGEYMSPNILAS